MSYLLFVDCHSLVVFQGLGVTLRKISAFAKYSQVMNDNLFFQQKVFSTRTPSHPVQVFVLLPNTLVSLGGISKREFCLETWVSSIANRSSAAVCFYCLFGIIILDKHFLFYVTHLGNRVISAGHKLVSSRYLRRRLCPSVT